jgi:hypothetical protein
MRRMRGSASAIVALSATTNPEFTLAASDCEATSASKRRNQKRGFSPDKIQVFELQRARVMARS